ncbi:hypothetical protein ACFX1W_041025 [Malus domestica]
MQYLLLQEEVGKVNMTEYISRLAVIAYMEYKKVSNLTHFNIFDFGLFAQQLNIVLDKTEKRKIKIGFLDLYLYELWF